MATRCPTLHPESSGVINDYAIKEDDARTSTNLNELLAAQHRVNLTAATKAGAAPTRMEPESAPVVPAHRRPNAHPEGKGRDASYPNPKYRGDPDSSESDASSGSSDPNSDSSDSSSFGDVIPDTPAVAGRGETRFTFWSYVNATALEDFDEKAPGRGGWRDSKALQCKAAGQTRSRSMR
ncbi:unnamed protein product [Phytophthora fragariaefolia]|uniref:Unnamed protein product n=1 Tax=Phytophthora fragariaefolia TaxID=1490495 RepID=A0A9W6U220_9STRA|nr:unnamed protein product [Phytophthora fragariaefolia]